MLIGFSSALFGAKGTTMEYRLLDGMEWIQHEQLVLGFAFIYDNLLKAPLNKLTCEDFFAPAHREAFAVMKRIATANGVDPSRVSAELPSGALHKVGGEVYLGSLLRNARGRGKEIKDSVEFLKHRSAKLGRAHVMKLAEVDARPVEWLWRPYLPGGMVAMLSGDPGVGKTYLALAIAAAVTTGEQSALSNQQSAEDGEQSALGNQQSAKDGEQSALSNQQSAKDKTGQGHKTGRRYKTPADVLYLSVENNPERVVRPRFDLLRGDPARFHLLQGVVRGTDTGEMLTRARLSDITVLGEAIKRTGARLVIVDPLQSYLDAAMNRADETRPVMDALCGLAQEHGCAVLLIRHLSKARTGRAVARGIGSIDLSGAVRSEMLAGRTEGTGAVVHVKSNVGELGPALGYAIDADGRFRWTGESTVTAPALLAAEKEPEPATALAKAEDFLRQELGRGRVAVKRVLQNARLMAISERTLERAKARLGIISRKEDSENGVWSWEIRSS